MLLLASFPARANILQTDLSTTLLPRQWLTSACDHEYDHLSDTIHRLKAFNAKRKWRAVAAVIMLGARLGLKKRARSVSEEGREDKNGCEQPGGLRWIVLEGEQRD